MGDLRQIYGDLYQGKLREASLQLSSGHDALECSDNIDILLSEVGNNLADLIDYIDASERRPDYDKDIDDLLSDAQDLSRDLAKFHKRASNMLRQIDDMMG